MKRRRPSLLLGVSRQRSDIDFLHDLDRIVDPYAEVPHRAFDLRVSK